MVLLVLLLSVTAALWVGTAAGNDQEALNKAKKNYNSAQKKCAKQHKLAQMPRILKFAAKIKKLGGGKIKKKQLYKCLNFTLRFDDTLTLKGSEHTDGRAITHNWSYFIDHLGPSELKPDYKDSTSDLAISSGEIFDTHEFKGSATYQVDGSDTISTEKSAGKVGTDAHSYGATLFINPSAKDPRQTIELSISANPAVERYSLNHANGDTEVQKGQVWLVAYNWVHRKQKDPAPFTRCGTTNFKHVAAGLPDAGSIVASFDQKTSTSMPLGAADNACVFPNGFRTFPNSAADNPWDIAKLHVDDTVSIQLHHAP